MWCSLQACTGSVARRCGLATRRWVRTALRFILRRASNTAMLGDAGHTESPAGTGVRDGESFATENTVRIRESGIRIGLGTDSMHGVIGYEMQWLVEHGWSTQEALVTATRHGGQLIDEPDVECWTRALGRICRCCATARSRTSQWSATLMPSIVRASRS